MTAPARIVRRLAADVVEIAPTYPDEPVLRLVDPFTGELYRISCSDAHNDNIIRALVEARR